MSIGVAYFLITLAVTSVGIVAAFGIYHKCSLKTPTDWNNFLNVVGIMLLTDVFVLVIVLLSTIK